jgi:hypothetical protein
MGKKIQKKIGAILGPIPTGYKGQMPGGGEISGDRETPSTKGRLSAQPGISLKRHQPIQLFFLQFSKIIFTFFKITKVRHKS